MSDFVQTESSASTPPANAELVDGVLDRHIAIVRLLQEIAVTANEATNIEDAMQRAIDLICGYTRWPVGHVFLLAEGTAELVSARIWHLDVPDGFELFQKASEATRFAPGIGLPGKILATGKPVWVADVRAEPDFIRGQNGVDLGIKGYLAFPVLSGAEVVGVLEFLLTRPLVPDTMVLDMMVQIGTQLGRVVERVRASETIARQAQSRAVELQTLLALSSELLAAASLDAILQRALYHALKLLPDTPRGAIYLLDEPGSQLSLRAGAGFDISPVLHVQLSAGVMEQIAANTHPAHVPEDVSSLLKTAVIDVVPVIDTYPEIKHIGALTIPLVAHEHMIGVLVVLSGQGSVPLDIIATLEGLANLTAAAILEDESRHTAATLSSQIAHLEDEQRMMAQRLSAAEAGMLQAARLAAVGELATAIAHEVNNPLYAARNALQLLAEDLSKVLPGSPFLEVARDELARIARIMQRMRTFARPERGDLAPHNLNRLLEEILALTDLTPRYAGVKVVFQPAADLLSVHCDRDLIRQVFLNLVLNALDAMPHGGTLCVRTVAGPTMALVEICDSGIGIPEDIRIHLFEPFFTTKPRGTGLGLATSAHIVTQHAGQITVDSKEGQGSVFHVTLPYQPHI